MKHETLSERKNDDGSSTVIEKTTQTPEDGFVSNSEFGGRWNPPGGDGGMFGGGRTKGHRVKIAFQSDDPKIMRRFLYPAFFLFILLAALIFAFLWALIGDPEARRELKLCFASFMALTAVCFLAIRKSIADREKRDRS